MNGSEAALWRFLGDILRPLGHVIRVENVVGSGTPDVNYCINGAEGWIELKHLPSWPKNKASVVRIPHKRLFKVQCAWLHARSVIGGRSWLFVQVGTDYILFNGTCALLIERGLTRAGWEAIATARWERSVDAIDLVKHLCSRD